MIVALFVYLGLQNAGFPDGHKTELERAQAPLYMIFISISVTYGAYLSYFGWTSNQQNTTRFWITITTYIIFYIFIMLINFYMSLHLSDGQGG